MRKIKFRAKRLDGQGWAVGYLVGHCTAADREGNLRKGQAVISTDGNQHYACDPATVGQYSGTKDKNGVEICAGDVVRFNQKNGEVISESGCYGIGFDECIDYDSMLKEIHEYTGCNNSLSVCANDNFISLWEISWNYNEEDNGLGAVEVIGNRWDNPELLGGAEK